MTLLCRPLRIVRSVERITMKYLTGLWTVMREYEKTTIGRHFTLNTTHRLFPALFSPTNSTPISPLFLMFCVSTL
ncbi:predicted protein [Sclerotinia sclerotiorum 1980 UF-70]|uniref:Uncharacterized protein n=1 Tax=Sclerotinia sclerotiorum (strain ATCC 18683 / 1980 / Ss-1) TaxID=665079 RepID=A7EJI2_SCLS1|nr:predicted protein [Sclerotinia sclerotiorum 1980 UF-70]EDO02998.1 predicted protein [Sclerotinia sclerotiorum 1980 UF-70]